MVIGHDLKQKEKQSGNSNYRVRHGSSSRVVDVCIGNGIRFKQNI